MSAAFDVRAWTLYAASVEFGTVVARFANSGCVGSGRSGKTHKPVHGSLMPCHTNVPLYVTSQFSLVYVTMHPASHNDFMDTRDVCVRPGTM